MLLKPKHPSTIWDGTSLTRTSRNRERAPDWEDWDQAVAEIIALETYSVGGLGRGTPTISLGTIAGTDTKGNVSVSSGTAYADSTVVATITFSTPLAAAPSAVIITPAGPNAPTLRTYVICDANGFTIKTLDTPATSTTYKWNYLVLQ